jgi:thiol:disulfide interchange protein DsbC
MFRALIVLVLSIAAAWPAVGRADEAGVRKAFTERSGGLTPESVTRMPVGDLYEVVVNGPRGLNVFYTDEKVSFLFAGHLLDLRGAKEHDLTEDRLRQLGARDLAAARGNAIKRVKGNGKRVLYTFEDPNCPYCKKLHEELQKVTNVTIYTFLFPILSQDSVDKSRLIWCAKDRVKAWDEAMSRAGTITSTRKDCDAPLQSNTQLARRFAVSGTPAVYLANGEQIGGYLPAEQIEQKLAASR